MSTTNRSTTARISTRNLLPEYLAFALGHDHYNTLYEAPYRGITFQGKTYLSINSPYRRDDVSVIYSHSLEEGSWNPIPGEWLADGPESLLKGSRRNISVNIPDDTPALFIKVLATPPALSN